MSGINSYNNWCSTHRTADFVRVLDALAGQEYEQCPQCILEELADKGNKDLDTVKLRDGAKPIEEDPEHPTMLLADPNTCRHELCTERGEAECMKCEARYCAEHMDVSGVFCVSCADTFDDDFDEDVEDLGCGCSQPPVHLRQGDKNYAL